MTAAEALSRDHHHPEPGMVHDPVCGMTVDPAKARHRAEHAGQSYFFCGAKCREKFTADPARYVITSPRPRAPLTAAARRGPVDLPDASADRA
jgi:Cu+-exporting ATPase